MIWCPGNGRTSAPTTRKLHQVVMERSCSILKFCLLNFGISGCVLLKTLHLTQFLLYPLIDLVSLEQLECGSGSFRWISIVPGCRKGKTDVWILESGSLATAGLPASLRLFSAVIDVRSHQRIQKSSEDTRASARPPFSRHRFLNQQRYWN